MLRHERVIDSANFGGDSIEIVELTDLKGATSGYTAQQLFFMKQSGVSLKYVRVKLNGGKVTTESGALYYSKGNIQNNVNIGGVGGVAKKLLKSTLTQETAFNPEYSGVGEVVLEPTFAHYILLTLEGESFIVDKGLFYCSIGEVEVKPVAQSNISSAFMGGEGFFQTKISGKGAVVLAIDVPMEEIEIYNLNNERVQVDGNFAILRSSDIRFSVQKSSKSLIGSALGGEGLLQTFEGTGMVWLAPTSPMYRKMNFGGMGMVTASQGSSHNIQ